jgi:hypothetical protein
VTTTTILGMPEKTVYIAAGVAMALLLVLMAEEPARGGSRNEAMSSEW